MLCVYKHRNTFNRDDEFGREQYDDESDHGKHDSRGSANLRRSLQSSLTREGLGGVRSLWGFTFARVGRVSKHYTSIVVRDWRLLPDEIEIGPMSMIAYVYISMTPIVESLSEYSLKYSGCVSYHFQVKARHSCTDDSGIENRDCGTCVGQSHI